MEILLDKLDLAHEHTEALDAWKRTDKCTPWEDFWNTWVCRAQVRKITDEHEKAVSGPCPDLEKRDSGECDYEDDESCAECKSRRFWKALKAAGGEG